MLNRNEIILKHLKSGASLTTLQASQAYNITGLPVVVYRLRKKGWWIISEMKQSFYGSMYAVYKLHPAELDKKVFGL
jgi:hypothetical protein